MGNTIYRRKRALDWSLFVINGINVFVYTNILLEGSGGME
jgi:hypothetical protein